VRLETMSSAIDEDVATILLNRPHVLNCLNEQSVRDLHTILDELASRDQIRVIVVRGAGRAFSSGIDLTALAASEIGSTFFREWETALRKLETLNALVIAAIHSHCIGGGLQLALACDVRLARDDARFGLTAVKEGIIPGLGMWRAARHIGIGRTKWLALGAHVVDAITARTWGLVDEVRDAASFDAELDRLIARLKAMAVTSTRLTKQLTNVAFDLSYEECLERFIDYQRRSVESTEHREAMAEWRVRARRPVADPVSNGLPQ
jgi:enoyl-CoA hydratase/carnithine racemase